MIRKIRIRTDKREEFKDITSEVQRVVDESGIKDGICVVYVPHTTAGITINENADPSVRKDIITTLAKLVPYYADYTHLEGNADAHIKSVLVGQSVSIPISDGKLMLGRWQGIFFCEFDGPRNREVLVKIWG